MHQKQASRTKMRLVLCVRDGCEMREYLKYGLQNTAQQAIIKKLAEYYGAQSKKVYDTTELHGCVECRAV
jgi:hypothetical protein